ncbi:MAG: hypothetical protein AB1393_10430 [Candidatus Edwardsbacteria bacterium]
MITKDENHKELSIVPELLYQSKYDEAIKLCYKVLRVLRNNSGRIHTWSLLGMLYVYKAVCDETADRNQLARDYKLTARMMLKPFKVFQQIAPIDNRDMGLGYLGRYQTKTDRTDEQEEHRPSDLNYWLVGADLEQARKATLSRVYSTLSHMSYDGKKIEQNISEANEAIDLDSQNYEIYWHLYKIFSYLEDVENQTILLKKCLPAFPRDPNPCGELGKLFFQRKEFKEAGIHFMLAARRSYYIYLNLTPKIYDRLENITIHDILQKLSQKPEEPEDDFHFHQYILFKSKADLSLGLTSWSENDLERAERYLLKAWKLTLKAASWNIHPNDRTIDTAFQSSLAVLKIDKAIKAFYQCTIEHPIFKEFNNCVYILERTMRNIYDNIVPVLDLNTYVSLPFIIAERFYALILFAAIWDKISHDTVFDYLLVQSKQIFFNFPGSIPDLPQNAVANFIQALQNSEEVLTIFCKACALTREMFRKHEFPSAIVAVNDLENFIIEIYQCRTIEELRKKRWDLLIANFIPSIKQLSVSTCGIEKIIKQLTDPRFLDVSLKIAQGFQELPEQIARLTNAWEKKLEARPVYINFGSERIVISQGVDENRKELLNEKKTQQPYELLEYLVAKDDHRVHWAEGIRVFDEWQIVQKDLVELEKRFGVIVSKLSSLRQEGIFKKHGIDMQIVSVGAGTWELKGEYSSNIQKAKQLCKEAYESFVKEDFTKAKTLLAGALKEYPGWATAWKLLVGLLSSVAIEDGLLSEALSFFAKKTIVLEGLIRVVKQTIGEQPKVQLENLLTSLCHESESVNKAYSKLLTWKTKQNLYLPIEKELSEYRKLRQLIEDNARIEELKENEIVKQVVRSIQKMFYGYKVKVSLKNAAKILENAIINYKQEWQFHRYPTPETIERFLVQIVRKRNEELGQPGEESALDMLQSNEKRDFRRYLKVERRLRQELGKKPSEEECLKKLCAERKRGPEYADYMKSLIRKVSKKVPLRAEHTTQAEEPAWWEEQQERFDQHVKPLLGGSEESEEE